MNENITDKLNKGSIDVWSLREKLALASAVMKSGNQNWVSVSRSLKPFQDVGRPSDWFSQINCARQYQEMLEKSGARRKRGDNETSGDVIVRRLITERIDEIKETISDLAEKYKRLKKDLELVKSETLGEGDSLKEMWQKLRMEKAAAIEARRILDEQALRMLSPSKEDLSTDQIMEIPYIEEACEDVEQNTATDFLQNDDDRLSQSTSSSHVTENVTCGDLPVTLDVTVDGDFEVEVKQEQINNYNLDAKEDAHEEQTTLGIVKEDSEEVEQEVKVEVKCEVEAPDCIASEALCGPPKASTKMIDEKYEEDVVRVSTDETDHCDAAEEDKRVEEEEVAVEHPDEVEEDIVISTEEIIEDVDGKIAPEPVGASLEQEEEDEEEEEASNVEDVAAFTNPSETDAPVEEDIREVDDQKVVEEEEEEVERKEVEESEKDLPVSPAYIPIETNIEEPKTHDSVDTEPSAPVESVDSKIAVCPLKIEYEEQTSIASSSDVTSKTKTPTKQSRQPSSKSKRESSKRKSNFPKTPKSSAIKEESEISSKAGSSDEEEEEKNFDEPIKISGGPFIKSKLDLNESLPNSPASVCNSDTEDERAHKVWKKAIMLVWRAISNHKFANIFMHPVTEDIAPGYHNVIFKPMDLNTIRKNIDLSHIRSTREFQRDMMLMFTNALMYNHSSHDVHKMARTMYQDAMVQIEQFVSTQVMIRSEPKLLRTSRRSDTGISDKEEEMRKRKASEVDPCTPIPAKKRRY